MSTFPSIVQEGPSWEIGFCLPRGLRATLQPELDDPSDFVGLTPTRDQIEGIVETLDGCDDKHRAEKILYVLLDSVPLEWEVWGDSESCTLSEPPTTTQPDSALGITAEWLKPVAMTVPSEHWQNLVGLTYPSDEQGFIWVLLARLLP